MHRGGELLTNSVSQERFPFSFSDLLPFPKVTSDVFKLVPIRRDATRPPRRRLESCGVVRSFFLRALSPSLPPSTVSPAIPSLLVLSSARENSTMTLRRRRRRRPFPILQIRRRRGLTLPIALSPTYMHTGLLQTFIQNEMQVICSSVGPSKMLH